MCVLLSCVCVWEVRCSLAPRKQQAARTGATGVASILKGPAKSLGYRGCCLTALPLDCLGGILLEDV